MCNNKTSVILLAMLATILTWSATFDCRFFTTTVSGNDGEGSENITFAFGLLSMEQTDVLTSNIGITKVTFCKMYERDFKDALFDSHFWAASVLGIIACAISVFIMFWSCCTTSPRAFKALSYISFLLAILTGLEFVSFIWSCDSSPAFKTYPLSSHLTFHSYHFNQAFVMRPILVT